MLGEKIDTMAADIAEIKTSTKVTEVYTKSNTKRIDVVESRVDDITAEGLPLRTKDWGGIILLLIAFTTLILAVIKARA